MLQYKNEKRKNTDFLTYTISDYLIGLRTTRGYETVVDGKAVYPKFETQLGILKSAKTRFKNAIFDISEVLQADIFDSEIEAAKELNKICSYATVIQKIFQQCSFLLYASEIALSYLACICSFA